MPVAPTLVDILRGDGLDDIPGNAFGGGDNNDNEDEDQQNGTEDDPVPEGACVECKDQQAQVFCEQCQEDFCEVCAGMIHRTGGRKRHVLKSLGVVGGSTELANQQPEEGEQDEAKDEGGEEDVEMEGGDASVDVGAMGVSFSAQSGRVETAEGTSFGEWITKRARYIPLRLTLRERKVLRLLEAGLKVSEYTDKIDVLMYGNKAKRIVAQIKELCAILSGLVLASDYKVGQTLFEDRQFEDNEDFYQRMFEIG
ncbi:hypothetical protein IWW38_006365, partial [Coemansia aciculifera]